MLITIVGFVNVVAQKWKRRFFRDPQNYEVDFNLNDTGQTGTKERCVFNAVKSFHVMENYSVGISHGIFEGVSMYDITEILHQCIVVDKIFSIHVFNDKLKYFNYSKNCNKPPVISIDNLKKKENKYVLFQNEMFYFICWPYLRTNHSRRQYILEALYCTQTNFRHCAI